MKKYLLFLLAAILPALRIGAQQPPGVACQEWQVVAGDTRFDRVAQIAAAAQRVET